jgi:methylaspartate ammonia-lyase
MEIVDVMLAPCVGGFYYDDQAAIRAGAELDGFLYLGRAMSPGFDSIRTQSRALGIGLALTDGHVAWGDMMTVQYAGVSGREPRFDPIAIQERLKVELVPNLIGRRVTRFRAMERAICSGYERQKSIAYGLSQALLCAVAHTRGQSIAEVIWEEYGFPPCAKPVPILSQSGDDRYSNVDKMILRRVDVLPHGLINRAELVGIRGERLREYVRWVAARISKHGPKHYRPTLHFDVYGGIGAALNNDIGAVVDFLGFVQEDAAPYPVQIEAVADFGSRDGQIEGCSAIRASLRTKGIAVRIVADEWCNTIDDVNAFNAAGAADMVQLKMPDVGSLADVISCIQSCKLARVGAYLGGSCAETDTSARIAAQVAVAAQADMMLAKPGMGVDEGHMIVANEQSRLLAQLRRRLGGGAE